MNILDKFENTVKNYPQKLAFIDDFKQLTFEELKISALNIAENILNRINKSNFDDNIICIYTKRSVIQVELMLGILYSGCTYVVLDIVSPRTRIEKILSVVNPLLIIEGEEGDFVKNINNNYAVISFDNIIEKSISFENAYRQKELLISTTPAYILFTSGSTGIPKGCVVDHDNVINYTDWVISEFNFDENTIFGSQTPLYFSMSITDVYSTLFTGATLYLISKIDFSFPAGLINKLNKYRVNTIYWVPSAYAILANLKIFDYVLIENLKCALFAGEVMMSKTLIEWQKYYKDVLFANLFGPTETTDICTFYKVNRKFELGQTIPIGTPCKNLGVMLLDENQKPSTVGELVCKGSFVAKGYYKNEEKTALAFVQNPLHNNYIDIVYRTGDICKYNEYGELEYVGRIDFQIKHAGYRIELGEIENVLSKIEGLRVSVCVYNKEEDKIVLIYDGKIKEDELNKKIKDLLPHYMIPQIIIKTNKINYNQNGKIDRTFYRKEYGGKK